MKENQKYAYYKGFKFDFDKNAIILENEDRACTFYEIIDEGNFIDSVINSSEKYQGQLVFIVIFRNYLWKVPYKIDNDGIIELITVFPSRKLKKQYPNIIS